MEVQEACDVPNAEHNFQMEFYKEAYEDLKIERDYLKKQYDDLKDKFEAYMDDFIENEKENKQLRTVIWDSLKAIIKIIKNLESEISLPFEDLVDDISE